MDEIKKLKLLLKRALWRVEEMASLTESEDDAALADEIKDCLGAE